MGIVLVRDQLTPHFRLDEFVNHQDGDAMMITPEFIRFVLMLEQFRVWYGRPVNITSGYRTSAFNRKVGGATNSLHMQAIAADFSLPMGEFGGYGKARQEQFLRNIRDKWYAICDAEGVPGSVLWYSTFVHLDRRTNTRYFDDRRGK